MAETSELSGLRVMVVDDNADAAEAMAWLLADLGAEARVALDAANIVALVKQFDPRLVLLDLSLPGIQGYEACRLIREVKGAEILVAAWTGWSDAEHRLRCRQAGFDVHLTKPVGIDALIEIGKAALRRQVPQ